MATKLRLVASVLAVVTLVLVGTTAGIAASGNGGANTQTNGNGKPLASGNENANAGGNGSSNVGGTDNTNAGANGTQSSNAGGNESSKAGDNGNRNAGGNGTAIGNGNSDKSGNAPGGGNTKVTLCHDPTGDAVTLSVADDAVPAHLAHGDYLGPCVEPPVDDEDDGEQDEEEETDEPEDNPQHEGDDASPPALIDVLGSTAASPTESRTVYCSTKGPIERGNGDGPGIALNLTESQGALLVEKGLVTPAIFYAGLGVSCDRLPGFVDSGLWVDHVGDVVAGVAVYPLYTRSAG